MLPARPSLPHEDASVASWSRSRCRIALRHFAGRGRPEHHPVRHLPPPPFQATLQRSQLPVPVGAGLLHLQPLKQLARRTPRLGLEPAVQLLRHCCKRVRTPSQPFAFCFGRAVDRTSPYCHAVRKPVRNCSSDGCSIAATISGVSAISTSRCCTARMSLSRRTGSSLVRCASTWRFTCSDALGSAINR